MQKIIVFDFDKTLTNYDTTYSFFIYCCKLSPIKFTFLPFFLFVKMLSKIKIISIKFEKEIGLFIFCPGDYCRFEELCKGFSSKIIFNNIYYDNYLKAISNKSNNVLIASASFLNYLKYTLPNATIIASTLVLDDTKMKIIGIQNHPYGRNKAILLKQNGFEKIDEFYTDSISDSFTSKISLITHWVKNGIIIKTNKSLF